MSDRTIIETQDAPQAAGPYSQATAGAGLVFMSGQLPIDPKTGELVDGVAAQTRQSLDNMKAILSARGLVTTDILKCTVFLTEMSAFDEMNKAYAEFFPDEAPARSAFAVVALPKGAMVEIEAIALDATS